MSDAVNLDAMIRRDDFAVKGSQVASAEPIKSLSIETLSSTGMLIPLLRKPDFQRETNHWTPVQVVSFLESFLDNELIPSIILWQSESFVFVIDGGHRLSTLRAWIEDDYGDGHISLAFYSNEISSGQRKVAAKIRKLVEDRIGKYSVVKRALIHPEDQDPKLVQRARNMATRSLSLQWVNGDAEKAETSFFKINTQGTPLDDTEELLLRNRACSVAIAARSIVRAGTGHKYWSKFPPVNITAIEQKSKKLHDLFFTPEVNQPIKTLDLPLGGTKSPILALDFLMNLISTTCADVGKSRRPIGEFAVDANGLKTIEVLNECLAVMTRMTGNDAGSLGLHPAVYFYSDKGRHIPDLLLGMVLLLKERIKNNDPTFFKKFIKARKGMEECLVAKKHLITQALQIARSKTRFERSADLFKFLVDECSNGVAPTDEGIVGVIIPSAQSKVLAISQGSAPAQFSNETKSQIYLRDSLQTALKCSICEGLIEPAKSVSYDHVDRVREGGSGRASNGKMTHPFCNTGVKN
jgi:hypothetical protein